MIDGDAGVLSRGESMPRRAKAVTHNTDGAMILGKLYQMAVAGMLCIGLAACERAPAVFSPDDIAQIELASKNWVESYNRNDWDALAAYFTLDAIMMPPNGSPVTGREAIAVWERENEQGFRIAFKLESITGSGELAYVRGSSCVFIPVGNSSYTVDIGKFMEVRERQADGAWLIAADIFNSNLAAGSDLAAACPFADLPGG